MEVLIALAIFGLSAVYLVDGAFIASRTIRVMKDTRELEQDLLWYVVKSFVRMIMKRWRRWRSADHKHGRN